MYTNHDWELRLAEIEAERELLEKEQNEWRLKTKPATTESGDIRLRIDKQFAKASRMQEHDTGDYAFGCKLECETRGEYEQWKQQFPNDWVREQAINLMQRAWSIEQALKKCLLASDDWCKPTAADCEKQRTAARNLRMEADKLYSSTKSE